MLLSRIFYGVRQMITLKLVKGKLTSLTETEARKLISLYDKSIKVTVGKSDDENLDTYSDFKLNSIHLDPSSLDEETVLHELGHMISYKDKKSHNYIYHHSESYTRESFMDTEEEAWTWAEKHASKPWGKPQRLFKRLCLDGYRAVKTSELGNL